MQSSTNNGQNKMIYNNATTRPFSSAESNPDLRPGHFQSNSVSYPPNAVALELAQLTDYQNNLESVNL